MRASQLARHLYIRLLRKRIKDELTRQRVKLLLWDIWGYWPWLTARLPPRDRLLLLGRFLRIDWNVLHGHKPIEISYVLRELTQRSSQDEIVIEAGCWKGGSTTKLSLVCERLDYRLIVCDSFEGVAPHAPVEGEFNFSGLYAATEDEVRTNLARYGANNFEIRKGWFSETLKPGSIRSTVRLVFIDCDLAPATADVLKGVLPALSVDGVVFTQDFHIPSVRQVLSIHKLETEHLARNLAACRQGATSSYVPASLFDSN